MYLPKHFRAGDDDVRALLAGIGTADLVTVTEAGLLATFLPLLYDPGDASAAPAVPRARGATTAAACRGVAAGASAPADATVAELSRIGGALLGHVARANPQWSTPAIGEAMVIVHGPDAYVSPSWYPSKAEHGKVVPTWNYTTFHVYGRLVVHDDPVWVELLVRRLTERHEAGRPSPWSVDDAPGPFVAGQVRSIVGVEVVITRFEAKAKWSQNRPAADIDGVEEGLGAVGRLDALDALRRARRAGGG